MRKGNIILFFVLALFITKEIQAADYDFRKTTWGMSVTDVLASETITPKYKNTDAVVYECKILGKNVLLAYQFIQDKLYASTYLLQDKHINQTDFIQDYQDFKATITNKYGQPIKEKIIWKKDFLKDDPSYYGMAISMGHLSYSSMWKIKNGTVGIGLTGDNLKITCGIFYSSSEFEYLSTQKQAAQDNIDF